MSVAPGDVLLLACYELGHQPLSLAWPAAVLQRAGIPATVVDLAVDPLPREIAASARFIGISVPMHTALRLGVRAAAEVRALNSQAHICFYGLYAWLNADYLLAGVADSVLAGELEDVLVERVAEVLANWQDPLSNPIPGGEGATYDQRPPTRSLVRLALPTPNRAGLPPLSRYAHYVEDGVAHLSGERERGGLVPGMSVAENLALKGSYDDARFFGRGLWRRRAAQEAAADAIARYGIEPPDPARDVATLSGGNAQKVAVARELGSGARVLVAVNPTRGLDVGSTRFVHERLLELRAAGGAVLLISTELDEVLALADRVVALVRGVFVAVPPDADAAALGAILLGPAAGGAAA